jgi:hypothetical protein
VFRIQRYGAGNHLFTNIVFSGNIVPAQRAGDSFPPIHILGNSGDPVYRVYLQLSNITDTASAQRTFQIDSTNVIAAITATNSTYNTIFLANSNIQTFTDLGDYVPPVVTNRITVLTVGELRVRP